MYGMVNRAIEDMVVMHHGGPVWEQIKAKAGPRNFLSVISAGIRS